MSDTDDLVFEAALDAPIAKVWRALTIPEYVERWVQPPDNAKLELVRVNANSLLTYRLLERDVESFVTIEVTSADDNTTFFRLTHSPPTIAANSNEAAPTAMLRAA